MNTMKKVLALTLALAMAFSLAAFAYTDDKSIDEDCVEAVNLLTALNILNGYSDGSIRPEATISRAEAAKMIYVLCNRGVDDKAVVYQGVSNFTDVPANIWYAGYVNYAVNNKIISGRGNGIFDPSAPVTGVELAKMLLNVAEYRTDIQGYTGSNWQSNVLKDAQYAGMLNNYSYGIGKAAPRQWAALLFANTIMDVDVAQYIGDMLWTGGIGGTSNNSQTVGAKRLGLFTEEGILIANNDVEIKAKLTDTDNGGTRNSSNSLIRVDDKNITLRDFDAPIDLLGQEIRVLYKAGNGTTTFTEIFGVYATGDSKVYDTTMDKVKIDKDGSDIKITVEGYNGGDAKTMDIGTDAKSLFANWYVNDYTTLKSITAQQNMVDFAKNRAEKVRFIDQNDDGILDLAFIQETKYYEVTRNNGKSTFAVSRTGENATLASSSSGYNKLVMKGTIEVDDVVAVTADYSTGECIYNVRKIEPTSVKASSWTYGSGKIDTVKLDGTSYKLAQLANTDKLDKDHETYYLDNGFVVSSTNEKLSAKAPANVALLLDVTRADAIESGAETDGWGNNTAPFYVKFLDENGKTVTAEYVIPDDERDNDDILGQDATTTSNHTDGAVGEWSDADDLSLELLKELQLATAKKVRGTQTNDVVMRMLVYVKDGSSVYFKNFDTETSLELAEDVSSNYYSATGRLNIDGKTYTTTADTFVFVSYKNSSGSTKNVKMTIDEIKGDIKGKPMSFLVDKDGNAIYGYIYLGSDNLPNSDSTAFAMMTGNYYVTDKTSSKQTVHLEGIGADGKTVDLVVKVNGDDNAIKTYVDGLKNKLVAYTINSDDEATITTLAAYVGADVDRHHDRGNITTVNSDGFRLNGGYYDNAEDIMVVVVSGDKGDETFTVGGAGDLMKISDNKAPAYVLSVDGDDGATTAKVVVITTNGENVAGYIN